MQLGASGILSGRAFIATAFALLLGAGASLCPVLCSEARAADSVAASAMPCHGVPGEDGSETPDPDSCTTCATLTVALAMPVSGVATPASAALPPGLVAQATTLPTGMAAAFAATWAPRPPSRPLFLLVSTLRL
jgi:hypothetical protein